MKICIAGGGTGGHLYTGIALAESWTDPALPGGPHLEPRDTHFIGGTYGMEGAILPRHPFPFTLLPASPMKGKRLRQKAKALVQLARAYFRAVSLFKHDRPRCVIGIGGYASAPALLAAWRLRIPRVLIDQNAIPGRANRALSRIADKVFVHFKEAMAFFPAEKVIQSGNPVRPGFRRAIREAVMPEVLQPILRWKQTDAPHRKVLLILGGSQGARAVNRLIVDWLSSLPLDSEWRQHLAVIHQTGKADDAEMQAAYAKLSWPSPTLVQPFLDPIVPYYLIADLVIARAGAGTVCELAACGKPSILIPFPYAADNHQDANARAMEAVGGAKVVIEKDATVYALQTLVIQMVSKEMLGHMGDSAKHLDFPDAAAIVLRNIER